MVELYFILKKHSRFANTELQELDSSIDYKQVERDLAFFIRDNRYNIKSAIENNSETSKEVVIKKCIAKSKSVNPWLDVKIQKGEIEKKVHEVEGVKHTKLDLNGINEIANNWAINDADSWRRYNTLKILRVFEKYKEIFLEYYDNLSGI